MANLDPIICASLRGRRKGDRLLRANADLRVGRPVVFALGMRDQNLAAAVAHFDGVMVRAIGNRDLMHPGMFRRKIGAGRVKDVITVEQAKLRSGKVRGDVE